MDDEPYPSAWEDFEKWFEEMQNKVIRIFGDHEKSFFWDCWKEAIKSYSNTLEIPED
jgi:hypothetical protein